MGLLQRESGYAADVLTPTERHLTAWEYAHEAEYEACCEGTWFGSNLSNLVPSSDPEPTFIRTWFRLLRSFASGGQADQESEETEEQVRRTALLSSGGDNARAQWRLRHGRQSSGIGSDGDALGWARCVGGPTV